MTDTTDDIAEDISFQAFEDDCQLLGNLLNDCLQHEVGNDFMEKVERARLLAQVFTAITHSSLVSSHLSPSLSIMVNYNFFWHDLPATFDWIHLLYYCGSMASCKCVLFCMFIQCVMIVFPQ